MFALGTTGRNMLNVVPTRRELLAWALAIVLAITTVILIIEPSPADAGGGFGPQTKVVFVTTGENFPDALGAGPLAALTLSPILLVARDSIPQATEDELNRLQPDVIYIVGGEAVVSSGVEMLLSGLPFEPVVTRLAGVDRYETAAAVSEWIYPLTGYHPRADFATSESLVEGDDTVQTMLTVQIDASSPGIIYVNGGAEFFTYTGAGDPIASCWIYSNGVEILGTQRDFELNSSGGDNSEENCQTSAAFPVGVGTYVITLRSQAASGVAANDRSLTAIWIGLDGSGNVPIP